MILVIGGTGTVGSGVVRYLAARGESVRVLTRAPEKAERFGPGIQAIVGDLEDPDTLTPAFEGVDRLFFVTPMVMEETELGLNAVRAARDARVSRIVYMAVHRFEEAPHIPHFQTKIPIANAVRDSGAEWTIIEPNSFFQTDLELREPITRYGLYNVPFGDVGLNRVDVRDIAAAVTNALTGEGHAGQTYPLIGPDALTGDDCARTWSEALGREVRYAGNDLDVWAAQARRTMPATLVYDLRQMFRYFQEDGLLATDEEFAQQARVLGHDPRPYRDFVAETARLWNETAPSP